ncbi:hypothetical protein JW978_02450 [Candidatus Dojkabacteria bacterium]|nr:hypothetical protein [Candidatus Dojkabacteria bacterium]
MKIKLPTSQKNITFFAKGDFFLNTLTFEWGAKGLIQKNASIERISRFNQDDLQTHIADTCDNEVIFFAKNINYRQNPSWSYIKREKTLERQSFEVLSRIYSTDKIQGFKIGFKEVSFFNYFAKNNTLEVKSEKVDLTTLDPSLLNNFLFDPYVDLENRSQIEEPVIKAFEKLLEKIEVSGMIVMMGEFVWADKMNSFIEILLKKSFQDKTTGEFDLLLDENGLWEGVLSELPEENELKYLNKENFNKNLILVSKIEIGRTLKINSNNEFESNRVLHPDPDHWVYSDFQNNESYGGRKYKGVLFGNKGKIKNFSSMNKLLKKRKDNVFEYYNEELKVKVDHSNVSKIRVFDYSNPDSFEKLEIGVIEGETVRKNQKLGNHFSSSIEGLIDLSDLKKGYILVRQMGQQKTKKFKNYLKLRPKIIFGENFEGSFDKDGVIVSNLYKTDFETFIRNGKKLIVADSIDLGLFNDIVDFDLGSLITIVILGGIDLTGLANPIKQVLKDSFVVVSPQRNDVLIAGRGNGEVQVIKKQNKLRVGQNVRIIHPKNWGTCATIVSLKNDLVGIKTDAKLDEIKTINLI